MSIFNDDGTTAVVSGLTATFNASTTGVYSGDSPDAGRWLEIDVADAILAAGDYTIIASGIIDAVAGDQVIYHASSISSDSSLT